MKRFFSGFVSVVAGNYGAILLSFGINVVLTRALGAPEFGHFALLIMVSQLLAFVVSNWTLAALVHFGAREFTASGTVESRCPTKRMTTTLGIGQCTPPPCARS